MISDRHKCIFVHIPKNGGASIEELIWDISERTEENLWLGFTKPHRNKYQTGGLQHLFAKYIQEEVGNDRFNAYWKFTMVRNPWDKAVSQFLYMQKRRDLREYLGMKRHASFIEYLHLIGQKKHVHWAPQVDFILDENGTCIVDDIFRFEEYKNSISAIRSKLRIPDSLATPHKNKSKRHPYWEYYTEETRGMVHEMFQSDIDYFNYEFNPDVSTDLKAMRPFPTPATWMESKLEDLKDKWR